MRVQDMFERLSYGEFSNLDLGLDGSGDIEASGQPRVVAGIGAALTALHTRFILRRAYHELVLETGIQEYEIDAPDLIKILAVDRADDAATADVDEARATPINHRNGATGRQIGAKIMAHNRVRFRDPAAGARYLVEYQANHPRLSLPVDPDQIISIMPALEEALQARVAAGVFQGMGGEGHKTTGDGHLARYEMLCQMAKLDDMASESGSEEHDRLRDKGFV